MLAATLLLAASAVGLLAQVEFSSDADLVVLHVTVADGQGKLIHNLPETAFQVYEDGLPQRVTLFRHEDVPVAVGLVVDNSGSMSRKLADVVAAGKAFAQSSNPEDEMFVVNFNERVSLGLPPGQAFATGPEELGAALSRIFAGGKTALYDAIALGLEHISRSNLEKKVLIVLSDGGDNASKRSFKDVLSLIRQCDAIIYTVGLFDADDGDSNPGVLRQLAEVSGGDAFFPEKVQDVASVLETVSHDIRNQYTVGYIPTDTTHDGTYRSIVVKLNVPHANHWIVRTRPGYFATPPEPKER